MYFTHRLDCELQNKINLILLDLKKKFKIESSSFNKCLKINLDLVIKVVLFQYLIWKMIVTDEILKNCFFLKFRDLTDLKFESENQCR